uniref:Uncharacterized protein n=1 Tax=Zooxanthella nutricula TaxID=1333877 RepID=A0A6U6JBX3_9DINO|mmetsp:Transcript_22324/g.66871  ORF Transcript_22324/g.66871 Transcript_22324/m.66871 type:complete len:153 (+) Transcript_22324:94-552(+)
MAHAAAIGVLTAAAFLAWSAAAVDASGRPPKHGVRERKPLTVEIPRLLVESHGVALASELVAGEVYDDRQRVIPELRVARLSITLSVSQASEVSKMFKELQSKVSIQGKAKVERPSDGKLMLTCEYRTPNFANTFATLRKVFAEHFGDEETV